ncbi:hypothetical protein Lalb_Chr05g0216911 [Lupinus albus]|uniref:Uncharacterized protein n=1 Tax=Lupinus albus TaxID=3870 RepID=A0A6A4QJ03_LUPAL|nr:hypothetical protein Lalb_Chr05g0216911 [Lupinus albus]
MAESLSSPTTSQSNSQPGAPNSLLNQPHQLPSTHSTPPPPPSSSTPLPSNPNFNLPLPLPPPQFSTSVIPPPSMPSFRPLLSQSFQFSPSYNPGAAPNLTFQNPPPDMASGAVAVPGSVPPMQSMMSYQIPPFHQANPALRQFSPFPNGYAAPPSGTTLGTACFLG